MKGRCFYAHVQAGSSLFSPQERKSGASFPDFLFGICPSAGLLFRFEWHGTGSQGTTLQYWRGLLYPPLTEIGMQRAIGMSASSLYKTFLWEGAYYGITASVIGSILGYICTIFIEAATSDTIQLVAIPVVSILEATLLAVGACLLATAIPLRKISNMSIVDSIETIE